MESTLKLLEERGYASMTIEQVAAEAQVGKATVYRSWPNKAALVLDAVRGRLPDVPTAETGNSREEMLSVAKQALAGFFGSPEVQAMLPALVADTVRNPELRRRLREEIIEPRKARSRAVLERAISRGDLPPDTDISLVLEMWAGAMMFRSVYFEDSFDDSVLSRLVDATISSPPRLPRTGP
ncbi:TetR/AcrR family transcriptional regulator [Kitasatospora sp. NPDC048296]|uniref:TetR/AcrR family transcriptional regulator n=1 Tax=Kitasatospora sp. NPDC048296 TaxID=3364048 RepID=UPI003717CA1E